MNADSGTPRADEFAKHYPISLTAYRELQAWERELAAAQAKLSKAESKHEACKMQAQIHAQEARTANATIAEIYQLCTGNTGEPGNRHGAEPVRKLVAELAEARKDADFTRAQKPLNRSIREGLDSSSSCKDQS